MTKIVRKSAMPTSTWLGGALWRAQALADEAQDDDDAREGGDAEEQRRDERQPADEEQELDGVGAVGPLHRRTVRSLRRSSQRTAPAREAVGVRRAVRGVELGVLADEAEVDRLVLGVGADRRDAVLGDADEHQLAAGADEVQRAVGAERHDGGRLQARALPAVLLGALDLLEHPGEAVDDGERRWPGRRRCAPASRCRSAARDLLGAAVGGQAQRRVLTGSRSRRARRPVRAAPG